MNDEMSRYVDNIDDIFVEEVRQRKAEEEKKTAKMVEVVRCKECIHYGKSLYGTENQGYCKETEWMTKYDWDFCSWGVKNE